MIKKNENIKKQKRYILLKVSIHHPRKHEPVMYDILSPSLFPQRTQSMIIPSLRCLSPMIPPPNATTPPPLTLPIKNIIHHHQPLPSMYYNITG